MGKIVNLGKEVVKSPDAKNYKCLLHATALGSLTQILSINGSGFIKSAFNIAKNIDVCQIQIYIDGVIVLDLNNTVASLSAGYLHGFTKNNPYSIGAAGAAVVPVYPLGSTGTSSSGSLENASTLMFNYPNEQALSNTGGLFILGELVRFESSFEVYAKKQSITTKTLIEYYLD